MKQTRFSVDYAKYDGGWRLFDGSKCIGRLCQDELALKAFARFLNNYCPVTMNARQFTSGYLLHEERIRP